MAEHKFAVGDRVHLLSHLSTPNLRPGVYTIVRIMPVASHGRQYRVKNSMDNHERVLDEAHMHSATVRP
jgi:hypothetical protein